MAETGGLIASFLLVSWNLLLSVMLLKLIRKFITVFLECNFYDLTVYNFYDKILLLIIPVMCNVFEKRRAQTGSFSEIRVTS